MEEKKGIQMSRKKSLENHPERTVERLKIFLTQKSITKVLFFAVNKEQHVWFYFLLLSDSYLLDFLYLFLLILFDNHSIHNALFQHHFPS